MRILHIEVQIYRVDNKNIMKYQEEILHSLNMIQQQVNKYSVTKKETSAMQVKTLRSHNRRDEHRGFRKSRSVSRNRCHHSRGNLTRTKYMHSRLEIIPSMSPIKNYMMRHGSDNLQGKMRKIKPLSFDGDNRKGEYAEAWLLGMMKYLQLHDYSSNVEAKVVAYDIQ